MDTRCLEEIGLSKAEINIYLALHRLGPATSGSLTRETGLRKSTIYESLNRLLEKGLVSYVLRNYTKYFEAVEPERIIDFVEEKKRKWETNEQDVKRLISELESSIGTTKPKAEAHVLTGVEGFKTMRRDVLKNSDGELFLIGAISREDKVMPVFYKQWDRERAKRKIRFRILHKRKTEDRVAKITKFMEMRFLKPEIQNPVVINIYGDRVVSLIWKGDYPLCFMLINREIADAYRKYFEMLWKSSKRA
ncbi:ArsR family transcriptional regulator [Candidatus Micrarchaeota archaeon]|nr:ArsR family transcriptional regulator [Candidatus Micrarchaeota archaeon]